MRDFIGHLLFCILFVLLGAVIGLNLAPILNNEEDKTKQVYVITDSLYKSTLDSINTKLINIENAFLLTKNDLEKELNSDQ